MFRNPKEKLSVFVKVMFWVLSISYAIFACGFALINTLFMLALDAVLTGASSSMGSIMGGNNTYSGGGSIIFIISYWAMAIISIISVVLVLYWVSLFILTVAEMNTELKETRETVRDIENNMHSSGHSGVTNSYYSQPSPVYTQPAPQPTPYYTPPQPYYGAPAYEPPIQEFDPPEPMFETPKQYNNPQPQVMPVQSRQPVEINPQPAPKPQAPPASPEPIKEPIVPPAGTEIPEPYTPPESKEDILSKYGPSGNYYR